MAVCSWFLGSNGLCSWEQLSCPDGDGNENDDGGGDGDDGGGGGGGDGDTSHFIVTTM